MNKSCGLFCKGLIKILLDFRAFASIGSNKMLGIFFVCLIFVVLLFTALTQSRNNHAKAIKNTFKTLMEKHLKYAK